MRVAFVTNFVTGYRKTFYQKLSRLEDIELLVFAGTQARETGRPDLGKDCSLPFKIEYIVNYEKVLGPFCVSWQKKVMQVVKRFDPDCLVLEGISGMLSNWLLGVWGRLTRRKIIMWACGWESQKEGTHSLIIKRMLMRLYFKMPHLLLVYSTKAKSYLEGLGIASSKIIVCYNGIEIDEMVANEHRVEQEADSIRREHSSSDKTLFLYVGGMLAEKRVDLLLDAFAQFSETRDDVLLWLVGDGPELVALQERAKALDMRNVTFWGRIFKGVDKFFAAADCFILPGIGGLALNQAMFWGTPCICSQADGTEDDLIFDGRTGYRFKKDDLHSLTEAMKSAMQLTKNNRTVEMGKRAKDLIVNRSNVSHMVQLFGEAFVKCLQPNHLQILSTLKNPAAKHPILNK